MKSALTPLLAAIAAFLPESEASTLVLHYGFGENGTVDENGYLKSSVDPYGTYTMDAVQNLGTLVSSGLAAPGSSSAMQGVRQSGADLAGVATSLNSGGGNGSFMLSFWINAATSSSNQTILQLNDDQFTVYLSPGRNLSVGKSGTFGLTSDCKADAGAWTHLALYYDAGANTYTFAKNGIVADTKSRSYNLQWGSNGRIGSYQNSGHTAVNQTLSGNTMLDELKVYRMEAGDDFATMAYSEYSFGYASIPEPGTAVLGLFGFTLTVFRRRRA